jgi:hypothetical protein
MPVNKTTFLDASNTREPSDSIWGTCPVDELGSDLRKGWIFYDDFRDLPLAPTETTQIAYGDYKVFATTSASVAPVHAVNSVDTGIVLANSVVVSTSASIAQPYGQARLSGVTGTDGKLWFEACVAIKGILATTQGFFLGLAETDLFTLATGVPINGGAATITNGGSMIGFQSIETGPLAINTVMSDRATSFTTIQAGVAGTLPVGLVPAFEPAGPPAGVAAGSFGATAYTFTKLGMIYDPAQSGGCITFFQDGLPFATQYSNASLIGTTNLKANSLAMMLAVIGTGTGAVYMKWWRCAQLYP